MVRLQERSFLAHIKCRYSYPVCTELGNNERIYHTYYWFCDGGDDYCPEGRHYKPGNEYAKDGIKIINPICQYCDHVQGEFEKTVNKYSYEYGALKLRGHKYTEG